MTLGLDGLASVNDEIKNLLPDGGVVILQGDLAAGKTTLVQSFAASCGINESVTSPTFSLQQHYGSTLFHYDIYNQGIEHFLSLGMLEELEKPGYHFIEWGDEKLAELLRSAQLPALIIRITKSTENRRVYEVNHA